MRNWLDCGIQDVSGSMSRWKKGTRDFFLKGLFQDQYCQRGGRYPIPGTIQCQVWWSYKKLDLVEYVLLIAGHWTR